MDFLEEIKHKSGLSTDEITQKINEKKAKFKDLLNDETAAFLVAKDLNVEIDDANVSLVPLNILDETHKNVNILVTIKRIFPKKEYKNGDKEGFYTNAIVYDNSKEMSITFWNKDFELSSGDIVLIKNVYVTKFKDGLKLNTSKLSEIKKKGKKEITLEEVSLNDLKENDSGKIVTGVLIRKRELRYFEKEGVKKAVFRFTLANESIKISVVVWGNLAEDIEKINENTKIKIKNVYVKLNNNWKEIHMTDNSSYEILEENVILDTEPILTKISELSYDKLSKINVKMKEFIRSYNADVCSVCNSKMEMKEGRFFCNQCNDFKETKKKVVLVYSVIDDSGLTNAVFFTKQTFVLLDADDTNVDDKLSGFKGLDTEIQLTGVLKRTQYADEFIVSRVYK